MEARRPRFRRFSNPAQDNSMMNRFRALALLALAPFTLTGSLAAQGNGSVTRSDHGILWENFDHSVRPQDDFFRHVNGTWLKNVRIPDDRATAGSFADLGEHNQELLRAIMEEAVAANAAPGTELRKIADLYTGYMDTARINAQGLTPLRGELDRIRALRAHNELPAHFASLWWLGVSTPFSVGVSQDPKDATRYVALVSQSGLGMPNKEYYVREGERFEQQRAAYVTYLEKLLRFAGDPDPAAGARDVMALEKRIAERHWDAARNRDREATYNPRSAAELNAATPSFSWDPFLAATRLAASPTFIVRQPDYFVALDTILASTPVATWQRYMTVQLIDSYADRLSSDIAQARFEFQSRALQGIEEDRERWKKGVAFVNAAMGEAVGKLYVERHFRPEAKARMDQMVANLREAYRTGINDLEWMTPTTQAKAQEKLAKFNVKIGYPSEWRDYSSLVIVAGDLIGNDMRRNRFNRERMVKRLGQPINRAEWFMTPQTVNAYYSSTMNEIVFPAAILQPPFFAMDADDALNYGGIGGVIGHEFSHGFDDQGSRSDGDGNLRDWWTEEDLNAFRERTSALVAQYEALSPLPGLNVNGRLTLGENIGDISGLAGAYRAYKISLGGREAPVIDGLTGDQRFFIGWAQIWRGQHREDALRRRLLTDTHSPYEYRTNQVLRNFDAFHEAFGTKPGDGMWLEPEKRVRIW
jgi:putative endopeptidase